MKGLLIAVLFGITVLTFVGCGKDPRQVQINGEKPGHLPKRHQGHEGVDCGRGRSSPPNAFLTPSDICTTMRRPTSSTVNPFMSLMSFRKVSRFFSVICTCRGSLPHPTKVSTVIPNNTAINKPFMFLLLL